MAQATPRGVLVISFDLPEAMDRSASSAASLKPLLALFERRHVPGTWASCDPASSSLAACLAASHAGHELALLVREPRTSGAHVSQLLARAAAKHVSTLALTQPGTADLLRVAHRHGFRAVRSGAGDLTGAGGSMSAWMGRLASVRTPSVRLSSPRKIAYGLVEIPATLHLAAPRGLARVRAALVEAAARGGMLHLVFGSDMLKLAAAGDVRTCAQILSDAAELQATAGLCVLTLGDAAARFARARVRQPAQSILRRAA